MERIFSYPLPLIWPWETNEEPQHKKDRQSSGAHLSIRYLMNPNIGLSYGTSAGGAPSSQPHAASSNVPPPVDLSWHALVPQQERDRFITKIHNTLLESIQPNDPAKMMELSLKLEQSFWRTASSKEDWYQKISQKLWALTKKRQQSQQQPVDGSAGSAAPANANTITALPPPLPMPNDPSAHNVAPIAMAIGPTVAAVTNAPGMMVPPTVVPNATSSSMMPPPPPITSSSLVNKFAPAAALSSKDEEAKYWMKLQLMRAYEKPLQNMADQIDRLRVREPHKQAAPNLLHISRTIRTMLSVLNDQPEKPPQPAHPRTLATLERAEQTITHWLNQLKKDPNRSRAAGAAGSSSTSTSSASSTGTTRYAGASGSSAQNTEMSLGEAFNTTSQPSTSASAALRHSRLAAAAAHSATGADMSMLTADGLPNTTAGHHQNTLHQTSDSRKRKTGSVSVPEISIAEALRIIRAELLAYCTADSYLKIKSVGDDGSSIVLIEDGQHESVLHLSRDVNFSPLLADSQSLIPRIEKHHPFGRLVNTRSHGAPRITPTSDALVDPAAAIRSFLDGYKSFCQSRDLLQREILALEKSNFKCDSMEDEDCFVVVITPALDVAPIQLRVPFNYAQMHRFESQLNGQREIQYHFGRIYDTSAYFQTIRDTFEDELLNKPHDSPTLTLLAETLHDAVMRARRTVTA